MADEEVDRLSALPDELLHHILSFIPATRSLIQTSILSKRWCHIWAHHPNLSFSMPHPEDSTDAAADEVDAIAKPYVLAVDRCLNSFASPTLNSFSVDLWLPSYSYKASSKVANRWLRFAGLRSARKLKVSARTFPGWKTRIPCSIFSCRSLVELRVIASIFPEVPCRFQGFRNLTLLEFVIGRISDHAVADLLDGCPLLETLLFTAVTGLTFVEISAQKSPRLENLTLLSYWDKWLQGASIDAPNLRSFQFRGDLSIFDFKGSPELIRAKIAAKSEELVSFENWMKNLSAVSNVSYLEVNHWFYQFAIPKNYSIEPLFKNLKGLYCDIDWVTGSVLRALTNGLRECPVLEKLLIDLDSDKRTALKKSVQEASTSSECSEDTMDGDISQPFRYANALLRRVEDEHEQGDWIPSNHPDELDYSLDHLKVVTMNAFLGSKNELRLAEFLLAKAVALEKLVVSDRLEREERQFQAVFSACPRASSQVQMKLSPYFEIRNRLIWSSIY